MKARTFFATIPILVGIALTYFLWQSFVSVALLYLVFLFIWLKRRSFREGAPYIAAGLLLGLIIEIMSTRLMRGGELAAYDFFGMPLWFPIASLYTLMLARRLAL